MNTVENTYLTNRLPSQVASTNAPDVIAINTLRNESHRMIRCAAVETPVGWGIAGYHNERLCLLEITKNKPDKNTIEEHLHKRWPDAEIEHIEEDAIPASWHSAPLLLIGTKFQFDVWMKLLHIDTGETRTYGEIADELEKPDSARAVGTAVGANPIAIRVPCHRVLPSTGGLGGYRWGTEIKRRLLAQEGVPV